MTQVFGHGRLRLYLLKLLADQPQHGYELIRLVEQRLAGLYAPSAGTIYPRLARLEADGLVTHTAVGGRKVYEITDHGRSELAHRSGELTDLEAAIDASVSDLSVLANQIQQEVRGSARDLQQELREASKQTRLRAQVSHPPRHGDDAAVNLQLGEFAGRIRDLTRAARAGGHAENTIRSAIGKALAAGLAAAEETLRRELAD